MAAMRRRVRFVGPAAIGRFPSGRLPPAVAGQVIGRWEPALLCLPDADVVEVDGLAGDGEVKAGLGFVSEAR